MGRLLSGLPWYSNYKRALSDDEQTAAEYAAMVTDLGDLDNSGPRVTDWDPWRELVADISDIIQQQTVSLVSAQVPKGKQRPKFKPGKRPVSAVTRALREREKELESQLELDLLRGLGI